MHNEQKNKNAVGLSTSSHTASDLYSIDCGFEQDECSFSHDISTAEMGPVTTYYWRRICENTAPGCSMRMDADDSEKSSIQSILLSPWFSTDSGVVSMWYRIPSKNATTKSKLSMYTRIDGGERKLIYLTSSEMERPWVPMSDEDFERPWVPMSVDVDMGQSLTFRFEIVGYMEDSTEDIYIDDFEFTPTSGAFSCNDQSNVFYADPNDCGKYFHCDGYRTWHRSCGPDTVFNPVISSCDWPYNVPGCD
ncbi:uncharacterized protein [Antedon mediterranea]|uniref:uncharacterized protein isoform X2 n=1 Tax=Antedon mediterranea TaxID=105859 RepID=UPI003AF7DA6F